MPSDALTSPSCIAPPRERVGSSSCSEITPPHRRWYCSALRSIPALVTGLPSSVKPRAPSCRSSAISVSCSPSRPRVTAGRKPTGTQASRAAASRRERSSGAESSTGSVFGIAITPAKPPAAAARVPEPRSSLCSWPGVRRCTWGSKKAGISASRPSPSTRSCPSSGSSDPAGAIWATWPPLTSTSCRPSIPARGSMTRTWVKSSVQGGRGAATRGSACLMPRGSP